MSKSVYLSNLSRWWSFERQEAALADVLPDATIYRDELDVCARRRHTPIDLLRRAAMLRVTTRRSNGGEIYVASLAPLAMSEDDMRAVQAEIEARGATLISIDDGPVDDVVVAWKVAKTKSRLAGAALLGAAVSAERRKAASAAGIAIIKARWSLPSSEHPTAALLAEAGLSLNTVKAHLGPRPIAQYNHRMKMVRKQRKEAQKT